jgi:hypothetical protein
MTTVGWGLTSGGGGSISEDLKYVRGWVHERFSACDLLQIAYAIWCICDLVSDFTSYLFFAPNCRCDLVYLQFGVRFRVRVCLSQLEIAQQIAQQIAPQIATPYRMLRVNSSNSECDSKSQIQQIASAISSKSDIKSHTKLLV